MGCGVTCGGNMRSNTKKIFKTIRRLIKTRNSWKYDSIGYCPSCSGKNLFIYSLDSEKWLTKVISTWNLSSSLKESLLKRENFFCSYCLANYRMRVHAKTVLKILGMSNTAEMLKKLKSDSSFCIYETADHNIFRDEKLKHLDNYVISEYFDNNPFGTYVNGMRNENLECLTFPDNNFDLLINSDVLEHVSDLNKALLEIKRVLKPGGFHVFTVPVDFELQKTRERAKIVNGKIEHFLEPVMHGDSIRRDGILAFRDFGKDVLDYMGRQGFLCKEYKYHKNGNYVTSVYYAQKQR